jgi:hypothetical protein
MAIATYAELQTAVGNWLARPNDPLVAALIPDWIALCEMRLNRELRLRAMEERATATVGAPLAALPAGFLGMRSLRLNTDPPTALDMVAPDLIDRVAAGAAAGRPRLFAVVDDEIRFAPAPDAAYNAEMIYWKRFDALSAGMSTNWLLNHAPDVYLFGTLVEAAAYLGDDDHARTWEARYQTAVRRLQESDDAGKWSGATPIIRTTGSNP